MVHGMDGVTVLGLHQLGRAVQMQALREALAVDMHAQRRIPFQEAAIYLWQYPVRVDLGHVLGAGDRQPVRRLRQVLFALALQRQFSFQESGCHFQARKRLGQRVMRGGRLVACAVRVAVRLPGQYGA
ncbi:hypothetical protein D3C81_1657310 [compost metagenome]